MTRRPQAQMDMAGFEALQRATIAYARQHGVIQPSAINNPEITRTNSFDPDFAMSAEQGENMRRSQVEFLKRIHQSHRR